MSYDADRLLAQLPSLYRIRDAEAALRLGLAKGEGGPLWQLLDAFARQLDLVEGDVAKLYDNWFVETCEEWVVPYIGDLLGARGLHGVSPKTFSRRAWLANTLAYRRRKGTATMLEQLARDTTGWPARAVEFFETLAVTQHYNHVRLHIDGTASLKDAEAADRFDGPFDPIAHTVDVRRIERDRGRHNIPNVGLFLWRLGAYPVGRVDDRGLPNDLARARSPAPADGRYRFHPAGVDSPLFNPPQTEDDISHLAEERNVPVPLRPRALSAELEAMRQAIADGAAAAIERRYFDGPDAVMQVWVEQNAGDPLALVDPAELQVCNLASWRRPASSRRYFRHADGASVDLPIKLSFDPILGRIAFPAAAAPPHGVWVRHSFGFPGDLGGGPYDRMETVRQVRDSADKPVFTQPTVWQCGVSPSAAAVSGERIVKSLKDAFNGWNAEPPDRIGVIVLMSSSTEAFAGAAALPPVHLKPGQRLLIVAGDWPIHIDTATGAPTRSDGEFDARNVRPLAIGDWRIEGDALAAGQSVRGECYLNGLMIEGRVEAAVDLGLLEIAHCTLVPAASRVSVDAGCAELSLRLVRSICGGIDVKPAIDSLGLQDCIVDGASPVIDAPLTSVTVDRSTVLGNVRAQVAWASESIFTGPLVAARRQEGCVRFSSLAAGSRVARRFRCQPDLAIAAVPAGGAANAILRVQPQFTSLRYGDAAYAQLASPVAAEISTGAEDGGEMGAWHFLQQPQRISNLRSSLDEYLRFGLEAGILNAT